MVLKIIYFVIFIHFAFVCTTAQILENETVTKYIYFMYYNGSTVNDYYRVPYSQGPLFADDPNFNKSCKTVFYFPGWNEKPSEHEESVDTIAAAFLQKTCVNLVVLDYAELVKGDIELEYPIAVINATAIGVAVGKYLQNYTIIVQAKDYVSLVGHSLGGQIMGIAARKYEPGKLPRIEGLDPAGPFYVPKRNLHINRNDADFVQCIQTDRGAYGELLCDAHAIFRPNCGSRYQPSCTPFTYEFCSHHKSWRYYAESVNNETAFPGQECNATAACPVQNSTCSSCNVQNVAYMGYGVNSSSRGIFYLKTAAKSPFGLGVKGFYCK